MPYGYSGQNPKLSGAAGAVVRAFGDLLLSDQGRPASRDISSGFALGGSVDDAVAEALEARKPGTTGPTVGAPDIAGNMPGGFSDHTWFFCGASAAKTGFTATAALTGQPNTYTFSGNTMTFDKNRGRPWTKAGVAVGVTKTGGMRIKGNLSYNQNYHYFPGRRRDIQLALERHWGMPWQQGEVITHELDSAAVNEVTLGGALVCYGGVPHPYPKTIDELCAFVGIVPTEIWTPQVSFTPGAASWGTASPLDTVSQEDAWLDADSVYYILGFVPHLVVTSGFLNFVNNLPAYWKSRQATIPFGPGAQLVTFDGDILSLPYEPIGPFEGSALPSASALATAATATTGSLVIAKV